MSTWRGIIEQYRQHLPITAKTRVISLCEGNTPLIRMRPMVGGTAPAQPVPPGRIRRGLAAVFQDGGGCEEGVDVVGAIRTGPGSRR